MPLFLLLAVALWSFGRYPGKTTLWEAGLDAARRRKLRVLSARGSGAETQLSFSALTDLLDGVDVSSARGVPQPQRYALEVALLRAEPGRAKPGSRAVAMGLLNVLRGLSSRPLVVAIDDVQWLDRPSADAVGSALATSGTSRVPSGAGRSG